MELIRYRISVNVSHNLSGQYNMEHVVIVEGKNKMSATENAKMYFIKLGYEVHNTNYLSVA